MQSKLVDKTLIAGRMRNILPTYYRGVDLSFSKHFCGTLPYYPKHTVLSSATTSSFLDQIPSNSILPTLSICTTRRKTTHLRSTCIPPIRPRSHLVWLYVQETPKAIYKKHKWKTELKEKKEYVCV